MFDRIKALFKKSEQEAIPEKELVIWGVMSEVMMGVDGELYMIVKASLDGEVFHTELYVEDLDHADDLIKHFQKNIEPITMKIGPLND